MYRACLALALAFVFTASSWAQKADDKKPAEPTRTPAEKKLLENPNDSQAWNAYMGEVITTINRPTTDTAAALRKVDAAEAFMAELQVTDSMAKSRLSTIKSMLQTSRKRLEVQNIALADLEKKLLENPDDSAAVNAYVTKIQVDLVSLARTQPSVAEQKLNDAKAVLTKAAEAATSDAAKRQITAARSASFMSLERAIETNKLSLADLGKKLIDNPNNLSNLSDFFNKVSLEVSQKMRSQPTEAATVVDQARDVFDLVEPVATNASIKSQITNYRRTLDAMARSVESGKKLAEMIGKDAAPLKAEAWVNGSPLTDADLKGKVVFLDFWAVWCGPCIATFPHLKEWNEKYGDKGLVMIGLTNYYNFKWDEDAKKASRATEKITPAEEQEMLVKFAESYELKHRFAIEANRSLSEFYGVTGIPHVVVIDQQGKIRMMKVGSGPANAKEIGDLLAELLEPKAAGEQ